MVVPVAAAATCHALSLLQAPSSIVAIKVCTHPSLRPVALMLDATKHDVSHEAPLSDPKQMEPGEVVVAAGVKTSFATKEGAGMRNSWF
jgi:hypothetical protein